LGITNRTLTNNLQVKYKTSSSMCPRLNESRRQYNLQNETIVLHTKLYLVLLITKKVYRSQWCLNPRPDEYGSDALSTELTPASTFPI